MKKLITVILFSVLLLTACKPTVPVECTPKEVDPASIVFISPTASTITAIVYPDDKNPGNRVSYPGEEEQFKLLQNLFTDLKLNPLSPEEQAALPRITDKSKADLELNFNAGDTLFIYSEGYLTIYVSNGCDKLPFSYHFSTETVKLLQVYFYLDQ